MGRVALFRGTGGGLCHVCSRCPNCVFEPSEKVFDASVLPARREVLTSRSRYDVLFESRGREFALACLLLTAIISLSLRAFLVSRLLEKVGFFFPLLSYSLCVSLADSRLRFWFFQSRVLTFSRFVAFPFLPPHPPPDPRPSSLSSISVTSRKTGT